MFSRVISSKSRKLFSSPHIGRYAVYTSSFSIQQQLTPRPQQNSCIHTTIAPPPSSSSSSSSSLSSLPLAATTTTTTTQQQYGKLKYASPFTQRLFYNFESYWHHFKNYLLFGTFGLFLSSFLLSSGIVLADNFKDWQGVPRVAQVVKPDNFAPEDHFYSRALNAQLHPMVRSFLEIGTKRIIERYCHLHPGVDPKALTQLLHYKPKYLHWAGADLFVVTNNRGERQLCVIETNTCPSGQKSMPLRSEMEEHGGYKRLLVRTFKQVMLDNIDPALYGAGLAVIYDKNDTETTGYAATLADVTGEDVYLVEYFDNDKNPPVKFENGIMYVRVPKGNTSFKYVAHSARTEEDEIREKEYLERAKNGEIEYDWVPIRAAFRYVTQKPWSRIPLQTKTRILNPVVVCLAGGRNKNIAAKAYDIFNSQLSHKSGLKNIQINTPTTQKDVDKVSIDFLLKQFGGVGVIKVPYMNAGQGVYTITSAEDLAEFHADPVSTKYDKFIVQSLIGNSTWSSVTPKGRLYHVGTMPDKRGETYAADIRMMIQFTQDDGWVPLSVYSRRARSPLAKNLKDKHASSWDMLGTNLSVKLGPNKWRSDTHRLMIMDTKDFNKLGIGLDDLISGYVQTVLAAIAIDQMADTLIHEDGSFNFDLFQGLNDDASLIDEFKWNQNLQFKPTKVIG